MRPTIDIQKQCSEIVSGFGSFSAWAYGNLYHSLLTLAGHISHKIDGGITKKYVT